THDSPTLVLNVEVTRTRDQRLPCPHCRASVAPESGSVEPNGPRRYQLRRTVGLVRRARHGFHRADGMRPAARTTTSETWTEKLRTEQRRRGHTERLRAHEPANPTSG